MILNTYRCTECEGLFELALRSMDASPPPCPECGGDVRKVFRGVNIGGRASTGPSREEMPRSWQALRGGDKELIAGWHKKAAERDRLEERHPELAGDRRPVLAHEGAFSSQPLRAGDPLPGQPGSSVSAAEASKPHSHD